VLQQLEAEIALLRITVAAQIARLGSLRVMFSVLVLASPSAE